MARNKKDPALVAELQEAVNHCEAIRRDTEDPQDISLSDYFEENKQMKMEDVYEGLGINPDVDTIQNIVAMPSRELRWLIPELYRDALRLGLRKNPIYPDIIAGEQSVKQTSITMPAINIADAAPHKVGVAETIKVGEISFDQKTVSIHKLGRGIKVPYEVVQYVPLNLVTLFMQDFGVKLAMGLDTLLIQTLQNGDQPSGTDATSVLGVATVNSLVFRDLLKIWVRGGRLGKKFSNIIAGEDMSIDILEMLVNTRLEGNQRAKVTVKTPIPTESNVFVHGAVPTNQAIILDPADTIIKLNAQPLLVESEKIIANQTEQTFASLTTGFATIFRDSRLIIDKSLAFSANGFPAYMDPTQQEIVTFE